MWSSRVPEGASPASSKAFTSKESSSCVCLGGRRLAESEWCRELEPHPKMEVAKTTGVSVEARAWTLWDGPSRGVLLRPNMAQYLSLHVRARVVSSMYRAAEITGLGYLMMDQYYGDKGLVSDITLLTGGPSSAYSIHSRVSQLVGIPDTTEVQHVRLCSKSKSPAKCLWVHTRKNLIHTRQIETQ